MHLGSFLLKLDQQFKEVLCLLQIGQATLVTPAGHILDDAALSEWNAVRVDIFDRLSISFEAHLLGDKIEFDEAGGTLTLRGLPTQLTEQLKRAAA